MRARPIYLLLLVAACAAPDPLPGYAPASAPERAGVVAVIYDYFAMRERAAVSGDATELFTAHPTLALHEDRRLGINTETFFVERVRLAKTQSEWAPRPIVRMSHELERIEPIGVYVTADKAVAFVHGLEHFDYPNGVPSSGEIFVRFDLRRTGHTWGILRTDEQVMGEGPPRTPAPRSSPASSQATSVTLRSSFALEAEA